MKKKIICPIYLPKPKSSVFHWKKASFGVRIPCLVPFFNLGIQFQALDRRLLPPARKESTPAEMLFEDIRDCGGISSLRQTGGPRPRPQGKVHIFWEGRKILRNLHQLFVLCTASQIIGGYFAKFCGLLTIYEF
jgi:hypothetical protein